MNVEGRVEALQRRHSSLHEDIERMSAAPSRDGAEIAQMKKRKLALKDEISSLSAGRMDA